MSAQIEPVVDVTIYPSYTNPGRAQIENAARAITTAYGEKWDALNESEREQCREYARAAIETLKGGVRS